MSKDIVRSAMRKALRALPYDQAFDEERKLLKKAIAIQKQNAKVIEAARTFREHGSGINGCYLNALGEELDALDALLSGEKV